MSEPTWIPLDAWLHGRQKGICANEASRCNVSSPLVMQRAVPQGICVVVICAAFEMGAVL